MSKEKLYFTDVKSIAELNLPWNTFSGCNILITGATGLIGSCLVEVLMARPGRDYSVYVMGRNEKRMDSLFEKYYRRIIGEFIKFAC